MVKNRQNKGKNNSTKSEDLHIGNDEEDNLNQYTDNNIIINIQVNKLEETNPQLNEVENLIKQIDEEKILRISKKDEEELEILLKKNE